MLKKTLFAAAAILAAISLAACGGSSKTADTQAEQAAQAAAEPAGEEAAELATLALADAGAATEAPAEGETTTEESDKKITSVMTDTNKEKETTTPAAEEAVKEEETTTPADTAALAPAPAVNTAVTPAQADDTAAEEEQEEAEETAERTGTVSADGDGLSLRDGPSSDNEFLDLIPDGTELVIEDEQDGWGYVEYGGTYGWVSLDYITE